MCVVVRDSVSVRERERERVVCGVGADPTSHSSNKPNELRAAPPDHCHSSCVSNFPASEWR